MQREETDRPYRCIFEAAGDGLILNDLETGLIVEANLAAGAMHGYTREDFIGLHPISYIRPDSYAQFPKWVEAVQSGEVFEVTAEHVRRDGTPFTVEVRGSGCSLSGSAVPPEHRP